MNTLIKLEFNKLFSYCTRQGAREAQDHVGRTGCRPQRHRGHQWSQTARPAQQASPTRYSSAFHAILATRQPCPAQSSFFLRPSSQANFLAVNSATGYSTSSCRGKTSSPSPATPFRSCGRTASSFSRSSTDSGRSTTASIQASPHGPAPGVAPRP